MLWESQMSRVTSAAAAVAAPYLCALEMNCGPMLMRDSNPQAVRSRLGDEEKPAVVADLAWLMKRYDL
jgi:hypothetical protein